MCRECAGVPCLVAVAQDASGAALDVALSCGGAIGGVPFNGIIETTFKEEVQKPIFMANKPCYVGGLDKAANRGELRKPSVEAGYAPEMADYLSACLESEAHRGSDV